MALAMTSMTAGSGGGEVHGDAGDDILKGGTGASYLFGEDGNDTLYAEGNTNQLFGGIGNDSLFGGTTSAKMFGGDGDDILSSGSGGGQAFGELGNDILIGGDGNDQLSGGCGADMLNGGAGADFLAGDAGADLLTGGNGADTFYFVSGDSTAAAMDTITDFTVGTDKLQLFGVKSTALNTVFDATIYATYSEAQAHATALITSGADDIVVFRGIDGNTYVFSDACNSNTVNLAIKLTGLKALATTDFI
ncbi:MAG: calcium-binding protein [Phenylobacterium zucineum]|nr:MAG: calcium-binding protein [Phenylobacterium zucineum]